MFVEHAERTDVVCHRKMASFILRDVWQKELDGDDDVTESERVAKGAAKFIRAEIREFDYSRVNYPLKHDKCDPTAGGKFVPPLLKALMDILVNNKVKELTISKLF